MDERQNRSHNDQIDELPNRVEHRRKIARRLALDTPEYTAEDPSHNADYPACGYRVFGPDLTGSGREPQG